MVQGKRRGVFLIDLFKFTYMFRAGFFILEIAVRGRNPLWFVNLDKAASLFVKFPALECGEFWVTENWIRGMISNYFTIRKSFLKNANLAFPAWNRKVYLKSANFTHWGFTRHTWPRLVFASNVLRSYGPCHEAHRLKIPTLGVADTNTVHGLISIAIPGNDEAATAQVFYNSMVSSFVIYTKYAFIHNWYLGCVSERVFSFERWWLTSFDAMPETIRPSLLNFNFDQLRYIVGGFQAQFLQDIWQQPYFENLRFLMGRFKQPSSQHIISFYGQRAGFFKSLKASWTMTTFTGSFLRPRGRRHYLHRPATRFSKTSFTKASNLEMLLRLPRWNKFFFRKIAPRLQRSRQRRRSSRFFSKMFSLLSSFSLFRNRSVFSQKFFKFTKPSVFRLRSRVRYPWFRHNHGERISLAKTYYRSFFRSRGRFPQARARLSLAPAPGYRPGLWKTKKLGYGYSALVHQFPREWAKGLWLVRYAASLGMLIPFLRPKSSKIYLTQTKKNPLNATMRTLPGKTLINPVKNLQSFSPKKHIVSGFKNDPSKLNLRPQHPHYYLAVGHHYVFYKPSFHHFDFFFLSNLRFYFSLVASRARPRYSSPKPLVKGGKRLYFFRYV